MGFEFHNCMATPLKALPPLFHRAIRSPSLFRRAIRSPSLFRRAIRSLLFLGFSLISDCCWSITVTCCCFCTCKCNVWTPKNTFAHNVFGTCKHNVLTSKRTFMHKEHPLFTIKSGYIHSNNRFCTHQIKWHSWFHSTDYLSLPISKLDKTKNLMVDRYDLEELQVNCYQWNLWRSTYPLT